MLLLDEQTKCLYAKATDGEDEPTLRLCKLKTLSGDRVEIPIERNYFADAAFFGKGSIFLNLLDSPKEKLKLVVPDNFSILPDAYYFFNLLNEYIYLRVAFGYRELPYFSMSEIPRVDYEYGNLYEIEHITDEAVYVRCVQSYHNYEATLAQRRNAYRKTTTIEQRLCNIEEILRNIDDERETDMDQIRHILY